MSNGEREWETISRQDSVIRHDAVSVDTGSGGEAVPVKWKDEEGVTVEEKHDISVSLTEKDWILFQLKAGLYANGSMEALVREAVVRFTHELPEEAHCLECGGELQDYAWTETFGKLRVTDLPGKKCQSCGQPLTPPIPLLAALQEVAERLPEGTVSFKDLLNP